MHGEDEIVHLKSLYRDMIAYNDFHLGILTEILGEMGLYDQTLFILTSDHGESFGEHGANSHGGVPFDEVIRVPLIMKFPESRFRGQVNELVQHIDIVPTILEAVGFSDRSPLIQGKSLIPLLERGEKVNEMVFAETQLRAHLPKSMALRTHDSKYIEIRPGAFDRRKLMKEIHTRLVWSVAKPRMLFSLIDDPLEKKNLVRKERGRVERFHRLVRAILRGNEEIAHGLSREKMEKAEMDEEISKQLKALGYFD